MGKTYEVFLEEISAITIFDALALGLDRYRAFPLPCHHSRFASPRFGKTSKAIKVSPH
jgi:hypothetical protein